MTPEEEAQYRKRLLDDADLIETIIRKRETKSPRRIWDSAPLMSTIVAVASLVFGFITTRDAKLREHELSIAVTERQERVAVLAGTHKLIATVLRGTQDRLQAAKGQLDELPAAQRDSILNAANAIDALWREQRESNDFLIPYHFASAAMVEEAWLHARDSLQQFIGCVETAYRRYNRSSAPDTTCGESSRGAKNGTTLLWGAVNAARK